MDKTTLVVDKLGLGVNQKNPQKIFWAHPVNMYNMDYKRKIDL